MSDPTNPHLFSLLKSMTLLDVLSFFWSAEGSSPSLVVLSCWNPSDMCDQTILVVQYWALDDKNVGSSKMSTFMIVGAGYTTWPRPRRYSVWPVVGGALCRRVSETVSDKRPREPACLSAAAVGVRETEEVDECQHAGDSAEHRVFHGRQGCHGQTEPSYVWENGGESVESRGDRNARSLAII